MLWKSFKWEILANILQKKSEMAYNYFTYKMKKKFTHRLILSPDGRLTKRKFMSEDKFLIVDDV